MTDHICCELASAFCLKGSVHEASHIYLLELFETKGKYVRTIYHDLSETSILISELMSIISRMMFNIGLDCMLLPQKSPNLTTNPLNVQEERIVPKQRPVLTKLHMRYATIPNPP